MRSSALLIALGLSAASPVAACGTDTDCTVLNGERTYRYFAPETGETMGAFFHAHGYRGTASGSMGNAGLRAMAERLGLVYVAINADADDWNLAYRPSEPRQAEAREYAYIQAVIDDLSGRVALDRDRLIATGFSAGGMMTWTLACGMSDAFAGFVPYAGTYWRGPPETCPTPPATVIHIHGKQDRTVPLAGRPIGQTRQGDVAESIATYAAFGDFGAPTPVAFPHGEGCEMRTGPGGELTLCLFEGGHSYSVDRVEWAIERILAAQ